MRTILLAEPVALGGPPLVGAVGLGLNNWCVWTPGWGPGAHLELDLAPPCPLDASSPLQLIRPAPSFASCL